MRRLLSTPGKNPLLHDNLTWLKRNGYKKKAELKNKITIINHWNLDWVKTKENPVQYFPANFYREEQLEKLTLNVYQQMQLIKSNSRFYLSTYIMLSLIYIALSAFILQNIY